MYTRVGRFDFMIKPKITSQNFIPVIDQNNRTALSNSHTNERVQLKVQGTSSNLRPGKENLKSKFTGCYLHNVTFLNRATPFAK